MTDREKTIVTAYTGVTMLQGEKLDLLYAYVSELLGFPVQTLDFVYMADKIQELSKLDFIKLCAEDTERPHGKWKEFTVSTFRGTDEFGEPKWGKGKKFICERCLRRTVIRENFCPSCGADMKNVEEEGER